MIYVTQEMIDTLVDSHLQAISQSTTPEACDLNFGMAVGFNTTMQLVGAISKERGVELARKFEQTWHQYRNALYSSARTWANAVATASSAYEKRTVAVSELVDYCMDEIENADETHKLTYALGQAHGVVSTLFGCGLMDRPRCEALQAKLFRFAEERMVLLTKQNTSR